jgi:hypothetical protein
MLEMRHNPSLGYWGYSTNKMEEEKESQEFKSTDGGAKPDGPDFFFEHGTWLS